MLVNVAGFNYVRTLLNENNSVIERIVNVGASFYTTYARTKKTAQIHCRRETSICRINQKRGAA
jgi:hypothetical protein